MQDKPLEGEAPPNVGDRAISGEVRRLGPPTRLTQVSNALTENPFVAWKPTSDLTEFTQQAVPCLDQLERVRSGHPIVLSIMIDTEPADPFSAFAATAVQCVGQEAAMPPFKPGLGVLRTVAKIGGVGRRRGG
jgi:hypothetical protein